jgi:hypothetical protein
MRLFLEPVDPPRRLLITDLGSPIDAGIISIYTEGGVLVFAGDSSRDLSYGPFQADVPAVVVKSQQVGDLGRAERDPNREGCFSLDVGTSSGSIQIESATGSLPVLICADSRGALRKQTHNDGAVCLFDTIPPGRYLVGPKAWVHQVRSLPNWLEDYTVEVLAGMETTVESLAEWAIERAIEGRIVLSPGVNAPTLLLSYSAHRIVTEGVASSWLDLDGRYSIPAGGPKPRALALVERWDGRVRVRGLVPPGVVAMVHENMVCIHAGPVQESIESIDIVFTQKGGWSGFPAGEQLGNVDFRVAVQPGGAVEFPIHSSVESISLRRNRDGEQFSVMLTGRPRQDITLDESW